MKYLLAPLVALLLSGCNTGPSTPIGNLNQVTGLDVAGALRLAQAGGDQAGVTCWTYLGQIIGSQQAILTAGLATNYELLRLFSQPPFATACGPTGLMTLPPVSPSMLPRIPLP